VNAFKNKENQAANQNLLEIIYKVHHEVVNDKRFVAFAQSVQINRRLRKFEHNPRVECINWNHKQNS